MSIDTAPSPASPFFPEVLQNNLSPELVPYYDPELCGGEFIRVDGKKFQIVSYFDDEVHRALNPLTEKLVDGRKTWYEAKNLLEDGSERDNIRGENVKFLALIDLETGNPVASLRKIYAPFGQIGTLPCFGKFAKAGAFDPAGLEMFRAMASGRQTVEISSLWKDDKYSSNVKVALYRKAMQDSYEANEVWFMGIVPTEYRGLLDGYGEQVVRKIGSTIRVDEKSASQKIVLRPVIIDARSFFTDLIDGARLARQNGDGKTYYGRQRTFMEFLRGFDLCKLDLATRQAYERIVNANV